jgi:hypothetical protein
MPGLLTAIIGLIGVAIGGWIANRNQKNERRHRRNAEQLRFYAELLSIRKMILAKSELRLRLHNASHKSWKEEIRPAIEQGPTPLVHELYARREGEFDKLSEYEDNQLRNEIIPLYRKMVDVWVANMGQAEESTQKHFAALVDFVEIWNRYLNNSLPQAVVRELTHQESSLYPLYDDIEKQVMRLKQELLK